MKDKKTNFNAKETVDFSLAHLDKMLPEILAEGQEPPAYLLPKIILAISHRRLFYARMEMIGSLAVSGISLSVVFFAVSELGRQFEQTGTLKILFLAFSDSMAILANWQDFALSFLESLPVWPFALTMAGFLLLLVSAGLIFNSLPKLNFNSTFKLNN
ncbi:MAG: hypothetical protein PHT44_03920 [Candidatus Portnoybacteria bacterium]|nr:hypothetical protein [Candidatus Portnoybacteria bacterium]MDD4983027.1 hypothetical protein [Candidatus Portnoybacteria bacterium]